MFPDETLRKSGQPPAPLGLQLASTMRYLALGAPVDVNEEASGLGRSTMQSFSAMFRDWVVKRFYVEWITAKQPHTREGLERLMKPFAECGLQGAMCSRDGVHLATDRAKSQHRPLMTGKEGYPTWCFDCSVGHNRQFLDVHGPFRGATNDKTMVRTSELVQRLSTDPLLSEHKYTVLTGVGPGNKQTMRGVHAINDGGYHRWVTN